MVGTSLLGDMLGRIAITGRALIGSEPQGALIDGARAILGSDGEATLVARAQGFLRAYVASPMAERVAFLETAARELGPDTILLEAAIERWRDTAADADARALHRASEPRSQELIRRLNRAPGGTAALVAMREDLIEAARDNSSLDWLDQDFAHLFRSWFNRGFLELRRIDWQTSAAILEKIIAYEAVHEIGSWRELRARVAAPDRQLYAFFHPALADDPLIFVEVALTRAIPEAIGPILSAKRDPLDPASATTAVFYSISNCQKGLKGVTFGNFLIKTVVEELRLAFPSLRTFVTLSPIPGLRPWAEGRGFAANGAPHAPERLAARYLTLESRDDGTPLDPVARFHLGNGASLERVNAGADGSARGQSESWGVMANYLYDLGRIERNHEAYAASGEIAQSAAIRKLARHDPKEGADV